MSTTLLAGSVLDVSNRPVLIFVVFSSLYSLFQGNSSTSITTTQQINQHSEDLPKNVYCSSYDTSETQIEDTGSERFPLFSCLSVWFVSPGWLWIPPTNAFSWIEERPPVLKLWIHYIFIFLHNQWTNYSISSLESSFERKKKRLV